MSENSITRRDLIKLGGVAAAGAVGASILSGSATAQAATFSTVKHSWDVPPAPISPDAIVEEVDAEIVVVGAGISGMPAIVKASEMGAVVHVVEKAATHGVQRSGAAAFNSKAQREAGMEFDRDEVLAKFWSVSDGLGGNITLNALFLDESGAFMDWLIDIEAKHGIKTTAIGPLEGFSSPLKFWPAYDLMHAFGDPNPFEGGNPDWMTPLEEEAIANGAVFHYNHTAEQLVRDDAGHGRVSAVIARNANGEYVKFNASKGIILATGDFLQDKEMVEAFCPYVLDVANDFGNKNNSGEMHKAALWVGADLETRSGADVFPGQTITGKNLRPELPFYSAFMDWSWGPAVATLPMLYVDITGRRCMNEQLQFIQGGNAVLSQPGARVWSIWDSAWQTKLAGYPEMTPFSMNTPEQIEIDIAEGLTVKADTVDELVDKIGVDPDIFKATLERYNAQCEAGYDPDCLKDAMWLTTIDEGPFYASCLGAATECTRGGLKIDTKIRVLDKGGLPIPGLYATGNTAGSFYGSTYPSVIVGSGVGHGMCFGYLAAINAVNGE